MSSDVLTRAIDALASGRDLPREQAGAVLGLIMRGEATDTQIAAFLIALRTKGETVDELAGLAGTMRALATPVPCDRGDLVDTAGTGGGKPTFNVSTTAALIAAGAGRALHRPRRLRLHVRPRPPRRHPLRRAGAQGARGAHDLQLPRAAHEPGRRAAAADR